MSNFSKRYNPTTLRVQPKSVVHGNKTADFNFLEQLKPTFLAILNGMHAVQLVCLCQLETVFIKSLVNLNINDLN